MEPNQQQAMRILQSWHTVEFFQPYSLPDKSDPNLEHIEISLEELQRCGEKLLPWLDANVRDQLNISHDRRHYYILYLGLFDKAILQSVSEMLFEPEHDPVKSNEYAERFDPQGKTCYAKLTLDPWGAPDFATMSVSTLPWALGHLMGEHNDPLTLEAFDKRNELLTQVIARIAAGLPAHPEASSKVTLGAHSLSQLLEQLYQWAGFTPPDHFSFVLDWKALPSNKTKNALVDQRSKLSGPEDGSKEDGSNTSQNTDPSNDEEESIQTLASNERVMPILNSFYIEDIERVLNSIADATCNKALFDYLTIRQNKHADLYTSQGLALIVDKLAPKLMPPGRWPSDPAHNMTLMQQFAINTAFDQLQTGGILSVNGPPGTGKTTLLRDIIAQNIVARAKVLATLEKAEDGLNDLGCPIDSLTGFEMVVASSNNLAVENLSKELPLLSSIAPCFGALDHFKPVANQIIAQKSKKGYLPLNDSEQCWGLISAVLGRNENRKKFKDGFFFDCHFNKESQQEAERPKAFDILNIYRWLGLYKDQGLGFIKAKQTFIQLLAQFEQQIEQLQQLSELQQWHNEHSESQWLATYQTAVTQAQDALLRAENKQTELEQQRLLADEQVTIEALKLEQLKSQKGSWLSNLLDKKAAKSYEQTLIASRQSLIDAKQAANDLRRSQIKLQDEIRHGEALLTNAKTALEEAKNHYAQTRQRLAQLLEIHQAKPMPKPNMNIQDEALQRNAFWQDDPLNRLRSELFIAALKLHQAWICSVYKSQRFKDAVYRIKDVVYGYPEFDRKPYWQLLFMFVPVVSSTFASIGRMFKGLKADDLGWLMIDEAGQAVPQAAVGAIWRAKRTLVVGDPQQIEPVFTTPAKLTQALCHSVLADDAPQWDPQLWSVQQISDRANRYGCQLNIDEQPQWIGIPLWVHRRCIEPMFSIANAIAYDNRMIHGLSGDHIAPQQHAVLGNNFWQISQGQCSVKQYKHELGRDTVNLLMRLAQSQQDLSTVYVISPFRAVKQQLVLAINEQKQRLCQLAGLSTKSYYQWLRRHIGTVHTFQGKENVTVILVLGCDKQQNGGAAWASSKPNLLNVALTRAKKHIYVIGDPAVWQNRRYFSELAEVLTFVY